VPFWTAAIRVLKPGGHLLAFGGSRTYHRLACAIEDAGFEIRDCIMWIYGSGFPKSLDVSKAIDKAAGAEREVVGTSPNWRESKRDREKNGSMEVRGENAGLLTGPPITNAARQWSGWGTALKPAHEPIIVARKPLNGTVAANVLQHGTGALNIDACRIDTDTSEMEGRSGKSTQNNVWGKGVGHSGMWQPNNAGRWPANVIHDGSDEVVSMFPDSDGQQGYVGPEQGLRPSVNGIYGDFGARPPSPPRADSGSAARFFYCAKADGNERGDSKHPTVKPLALMEYLVRLVTPPGGTVCDPFLGSGTTMQAAYLGNWRGVGIEREAVYFGDAVKRMEGELSNVVLFEPQVQRELLA
jgi:DNA modification methylase